MNALLLTAVLVTGEVVHVTAVQRVHDRDQNVYAVGLLDADGYVVTNSWVKYQRLPYQLFGSGTFDGIDFDVMGQGCVVDNSPAACYPDTPMRFSTRAGLFVDSQAIDGPIVQHSVRTGPIGDVTSDGRFDSSDLVTVFVAGQYEDNVVNGQINEAGQLNSVWDSGDWNLDREFDSSDLVAAFTAGTYEARAIAVPEPSTLVLVLVAWMTVRVARMWRLK